jgi:hypothetical protein
LIALGLLAGASSRASAGTSFDPFRPAGAKAPSLNPFRLAQAEAPKATPKPAPKACTSDAQCPDETICESKTCQPVPSSINIGYLYYREGTFREVLGLWWSKRGASGYHVVAPFYWRTWDGSGNSRVVAPFYWSFEDYKTRNVLRLGLPFFVRSANPDKAFTWAFPLNFFWRDKDDSHQLVIPLYYRSARKDGGSFFSWFGYSMKDGPRTEGSLLWLWWFGADRKASTAYNVVFPLVWDFKDKDDRVSFVPPLFWRFASADATTTVLVPWIHRRTATSGFDAVLPLWWSGHDDKEKTAFKLLVPLFYWQSRDAGRKSMWVSPVGGYSRDDDDRSRTGAIVPLLTFWRRDPERTVHVFSPLWVYARSESADATTRWLGLALFYRRDDPRGSTTAVTPLFWHFHDAETKGSATILPPVFARRDGPRDTTTFVGVFPVGAYWRSFKNGGWSGGLLPLAYFGNNAGRSHAVVFPLFWRTAGADDATTVAAPFYFGHHDPRGSASGVPVALTFWGSRDGESYAIQFPLLWHFASEREHTSTTVLPVGYYHRDPDGWSAGVGPGLPILWARSGKTRSHFVLFPVVWHFRDAKEDRSTTVVGPYWHRSWGGETTDALFPLLHWRRGARPGGADETSFTLFPLLHYHRDATTKVFVSPLAAYARGPQRSAGFVGPYLWYEDPQLKASFIPLLHADVLRKDTGDRTLQIGPWFKLTGRDRSAWALFPIAGHYRDAHESDTYVFPTFFHLRRDDGTKVDALLPLFWRSSGQGRSTTIVTLWFDHTAPGSHATGLFPAYFHLRDERRAVTVVPPLLYVHYTDLVNDRDRLWWLLAWHSRDKDKSRTVVFPLWFAQQSKDRGYKVLFPIFWRTNDQVEGKTSTLATLLYWSTWKTGYTAGLLPLVWHSHDKADDSGATGLMPLFYESHGPKRLLFATALFGFERAPASSFTYVMPFWFHRTDKVKESSTTVVPPLLFYRKTKPDETLTTAALLFWRHTDVTSSRTFAFPIYYDVHDYDVSRTTVVAPLVLRHANELTQNVWWVAPLFYRHSTPTTSTTVAFPFVWDFKRGAERTTIVFPFYASWHRADHDSTYIFPTIYRRTGLNADGTPDGTWHHVYAPFYASAVKRPGDFMWEILGGLVGHENVGRNRYLKLFFMRFEQEPAPRAQTAWYSQPTRTPRRERTRGLSLNTW